MTELETLLTAIEQRAEKATPGPWDDVKGETDTFGNTMIMLADTYENWREDVAFIAAARSDIPALVKAVRILSRQVDICGCSDCVAALADVDSILKGEKP